MDRLTKGKAGIAAYPLSQPLFNALRDGLDELGKQAKQLEEARDTIKNCHIAVDKVDFGNACGSVSSCTVLAYR